MFALILALQTAELPATVTEADFGALQQCLTDHPAMLGDNRCLPIDAGVARMEGCLESANDWRSADDCLEVQYFECGNELHAAGVEANLLLRYCGIRNLALLQALNAEQWERASARFPPGQVAELRLLFLAQLTRSQQMIAEDDYELAWLGVPTGFYKRWAVILDLVLRNHRGNEADTLT